MELKYKEEELIFLVGVTLPTVGAGAGEESGVETDFSQSSCQIGI